MHSPFLLLGILASLAMTAVQAAPRGGEVEEPNNNATSSLIHDAHPRTAPLRQASTSMSNTRAVCKSTTVITSTKTIPPLSRPSTITETVVQTRTVPPNSLESAATISTLLTTSTSTIKLPGSTTTSTVSSGTATQTIQPPPSFRPIRSSQKTTRYGGSGGWSPFRRRDFGSDLDTGNFSANASVVGETRSSLGVGRDHHNSSSSYDHQMFSNHTQSIAGSCAVSTIIAVTSVTESRTVVTSTATTISTVTGATRFTTITDTVTVTIAPTTTVTSRVPAAISTVWATCGTDNMADSYEGRAIVDVSRYFSQHRVLFNAGSAYACCVAAFTAPNTYSFWLYGHDGNCYLAMADVCRDGDQSNHYRLVVWYWLGQGVSSIGVMGNTACGQFDAHYYLPAD